MNERKRPISEVIALLASNWVGLFGIALAMCSLFATLCLIAIDFIHAFAHPYLGILTYLVFPSFMWIGLVFIGVGAWLERRRRKKQAGAVPGVELADWRRTRKLIAALAAGFLFLMLSALGSFQAYDVTDSVGFCGTLCHTVMKPEYSTYKRSPHARVKCVDCHIGPGASWFVRSKISGLYQVYATVTDIYPRPIPTPVKNLRPARATCERCHWPEKFYGYVEVNRQTFLPDKENTPWSLRLLLHVGGASATTGPVGGIHWHMIVANSIEYIATDKSRQTIPWVRVSNRETGAVTVYQSKDNPLKPGEKTQPMRVFDCVDCHNRPTHIFESPYRALDISLWLHRIDRSIPYIKMKAAQALVQGAKAGSQAQGVKMIAQILSKEYAAYPDQSKIRQAISETQKIFRDNFFPRMKTDWRVRGDNIGHFTRRGCFRCHDGMHVDKKGQAIASACNTCHIIIAQGSGPKPTEVSLQGLKFDHPGGELPPGILCNECHSGAP